MTCSADDLACLQDQLARAPMGLRIAEALLSDRVALALLASCALALVCLGVMVGKICSLLYDDINGIEEGRQPPATRNPQRTLSRTPRPQNRRTRGRSPSQRHEANRVQAESAPGAAPPAPPQAAEPDAPPPGLSERRLEGPPPPEPQAPVAPAATADTPSDEAPAGRARTAIYQRMMANDRSPPPPPPLTQLWSATSSTRRFWSDEALLAQGRQPVGQDPTHRSMRRSGSEASLASAANAQEAGRRYGGPPIDRAQALRLAGSSAPALIARHSQSASSSGLTQSATSGMTRSLSDQALLAQGRRSVNQDPTHRSMRRSGSEASSSAKGPRGIKTPTHRARASAANAPGAGSRHHASGLHVVQARHNGLANDASLGQSPALSSASRFYAHVVKANQSQAQPNTP